MSAAEWTPPAEAVEAAARALHEETSHPTPWESLPAWMVETKRYDAHAALTAARPALVADVLMRVAAVINGDYHDSLSVEDALVDLLAEYTDTEAAS